MIFLPKFDPELIVQLMGGAPTALMGRADVSIRACCKARR